MKKQIFFLFAYLLFSVQVAIAQAVAVELPATTITPSDIVGDAAIMALLMGVNVFIAYFSKVIPGLGAIPEIKIRAGVSAAALIVGVAFFKGGFFGSSTFPFVTQTLLLVLAAFGVGGSSGWLYDLLQKLIGSSFKSLK